MKVHLWSGLRNARYALPSALGHILPVPDAASVLNAADRLHRRGLTATLGYFHLGAEEPQAIAAANVAALAMAGRRSRDLYLSIKAPALQFDAGLVRDLAAAAARAGTFVMFDAHCPAHADRTLALAESLLADFPGTGCVLPARWRRSLADALRLRDSSARIRLVRGEWPDAEGDMPDIGASFGALVSQLAGRVAPVAVATHQPDIAERALHELLDTQTPCELEQLRSLPRRRTMAVARRLGAPVRVYLPFGPGWWPYAINKALDRPSLVLGTLQDCLVSA